MLKNRNMIRPLAWMFAGVTLVALALMGWRAALVHHGFNPSAPAQTTPAITKEYLDAARAIETAIMSGDVEAAEKLIDTPANVDIALQGLELPAGYRDQVLANIAPDSRAPRVMINTVKGGATLHLLHVGLHDGRVHAIYRVLALQGGLNYLDWTLMQERDGHIRGTDVYNASAGETASAGIRRVTMRALSEARTTTMPGLAAIDRVYLDHDKEIGAINEALNKRDWIGFLEIYDRLPGALRQEKMFFVNRLRALEYLNRIKTDEYRSAVEEYRRTFPGDPSLNINGLTSWALANDFPSCYAALDALEKWCGGDPYLLALRASLIQEENGPGANQEAERLAREAIVAEDHLVLAHTVVLLALTREKRFGEAVQELQVIDSFGKNLLNVESSAELKGLAASEEYQQYKPLRRAPH